MDKQCPTCSGSGKVKANSLDSKGKKVEITCPRCGGRGVVRA